MTQIFISYRRAASAGNAGRLFEKLINEFGKENVFLDTNSIPIGETFDSFILDRIEQSRVFLVLLSKGTLDRIHEPDDWVRNEIRHALQLPHLRVIPILVDSFPMPNTEELPEDIQELVRLNAAYLVHYLFDESCNYLIRQLHTLLTKDRHLDSDLVRFIRKEYDTQNYHHVVRFGRALSQPLWISGKYEERIIIGEMIEEAAAIIHKNSDQIAALIDDIGWTNVALGNFDIGEQKIRYGIKLALELGDDLSFWAAKGYRHLGAIEYRKGFGNQSLAHLDKALELTSQIKTVFDDPKREMEAGVYRSQAYSYFVLQNYDQALEALAKAQSEYEQLGQQEHRIIKLRIQQGYMLLRMGNILEARDIFRGGLHSSKQIGRKDAIAFNFQGLGETYILENNMEKALHFLNEASTIFTELKMVLELQRIQRLRSGDPDALSSPFVLM